MKNLKASLLAVITSLTILAGCENSSGTIQDVHTGEIVEHSKSYLVSSRLLSSLHVVAFVSHRGGETRYRLKTEYLSTGLGWAFFKEVWFFGQQLPFDVLREDLLGCSGGCSMMEEGSVRLTRAQFEQAAISGLEFKLVGQNRSVIAKVPAEAFQEALAQ